MNEEMDQMEKYDTWDLVPRPKEKNVTGTKWVLKNKLNEKVQVVRNKAHLVSKGYAEIRGVDFKENFSPIVIQETIKMFLPFVNHNNLKVYQVDVK